MRYLQFIYMQSFIEPQSNNIYIFVIVVVVEFWPWIFITLLQLIEVRWHSFKHISLKGISIKTTLDYCNTLTFSPLFSVIML